MSVSILVVDDEPDVAELFRQRFRGETRQGKYVLHYAASGAKALDRLAGEIEPTLVAVLSDINMPGMDGLQLLGEIKQRFPEARGRHLSDPALRMSTRATTRRRRPGTGCRARSARRKPWPAGRSSLRRLLTGLEPADRAGAPRRGLVEEAASPKFEAAVSRRGRRQRDGTGKFRGTAGWVEKSVRGRHRKHLHPRMK